MCIRDRTPNRFLETPKARYGYAESHCDDGDVTRYPGALTDAEWALVSNLFEHDGPGKPPKYPRRKLLDACCYAVRTECSWRMLPKEDVYKRQVMGSAVGSAWKGSDPLEEPGGYSESNSFAEGGYGVGSVAL